MPSPHALLKHRRMAKPTSDPEKKRRKGDKVKRPGITSTGTSTPQPESYISLVSSLREPPGEVRAEDFVVSPSEKTTTPLPTLPRRSIKPYYRPRPSLLDRVYMRESGELCRGFFNLLWVFAAFFVVISFINSVKAHGSIVDTSLFYLLTTNLGSLFFSDVCMVLCMTPALVWCKLVSLGYCPSKTVDIAVRLSYDVIFIAGGFHWARTSGWLWVQRTFFSTHTLVLAMKIHSYMARNSHFYHLLLKEQALELEKETLSGQDVLDTSEKERLVSVKEDIAYIHSQIDPGDLVYPKNITISNWIEYLAIPVLVYELGYPRTKSIRWSFVLEKSLGFFGCSFVLYTLIESNIVPLLKQAAAGSFLETLPQLMPVFLAAYLLSFYLLFECICNGFAELTRFADRNFYDDWWNSDSWDQFARRWNKPVHHFLLRHFYLPLRHTMGMSKDKANMVTFLFSSLSHEAFLYIIVGQPKFLLFAMQMSQLPLTWLGQAMGKRSVEFWGNAFFWIGLAFGPSVMTYVYTSNFWVETYGNANPLHG